MHFQDFTVLSERLFWDTGGSINVVQVISVQTIIYQLPYEATKTNRKAVHYFSINYTIHFRFLSPTMKRPHIWGELHFVFGLSSLQHVEHCQRLPDSEAIFSNESWVAQQSEKDNCLHRHEGFFSFPETRIVVGVIVQNVFSPKAPVEHPAESTRVAMKCFDNQHLQLLRHACESMPSPTSAQVQI